jgi:hypothetical protein
MHDLVKLPDTGSVAVHVLCTVLSRQAPEDEDKTVSLNVTTGLPHILLPADAVANPATLGCGVVGLGQPTKLDGQVIFGLALQPTHCIVTWNAPVAELPQLSIAVYVTKVDPIGNTVPGWCVVLKLANPQLSDAVGGVQLTTEEQFIPFTMIIISLGILVTTGF